ncbi:MAG TPA: endonuclease MutS2, partial [Desulfobacteria bacterium]|nr:endonuclease MutS2 [Desulfobacteria bacterium]
AGRILKKFISELPHHYPLLKERGGLIEPFTEIEHNVSRCIGEDAQVLDQASANLATIRRQIKGLQVRIKERLEQMVRGSEYQKFLQDPIITLRDDRYVIPVKQEYRSQIPGIVHDQSASGATLFVEPIAVVQMDNELRQMTTQEQQEVERILAELTRNIENKLAPIEGTMETLGYIDFVFAKGKLSVSMDAGEPKLNDRGYLTIVKGRHPLIQERPVPVSINVGQDFDTLVITGPNTGGKTVTLKIVGLFCLMAQAGLHLPAEHGTEIGVFTQIFADIGDEQSIEQSLSTFSSHMKNIVQILDCADSNTLALLDEVGAGTDPTEGAALAMAILKYLQSRGVKTIATTHYSELKTFAYNNSRVENASVEFDVATLRPTYRLLIGLPGRSNAFEIAGRLGLKDEVVAEARSLLSEQEVKVADLLQNLEETQRATQSDREEAAHLRNQIEEIKRSLEQERHRLAEEGHEIMAKAANQAAELVSKAKREAEQIISDLKAASTEERARFHSLNEAREKLKKLQKQTDDLAEHNQPLPGPGQQLKKVKVGQLVEIPKFRQKGYVLAAPNASGEVFVQIGIMKMFIKLTELRSTNEPQRQTYATGSGRIARNKAELVQRELDLRGMTVDEALYEVDKYLDDAVLSGMNQVHIIHGKGTGALRTAIKEHLTGHPHVKSFRLGEHGEGGTGISVVELK